MLCADDMGMGKTLQAIALCMANPPPHDWEGAATLVIVPKSLLNNWQAELNKFCRRKPLVRLHYDKTKAADEDDLEAEQFVITTYETVGLQSVAARHGSVP